MFGQKRKTWIELNWIKVVLYIISYSLMDVRDTGVSKSGEKNIELNQGGGLCHEPGPNGKLQAWPSGM